MTERAAPVRHRLTWRAAADLIAHASPRRATRTLCGKPVTLERLAHPEQRRCIACTVLSSGPNA